MTEIDSTPDFTPGEFITRQLQQKGWSQADLAAVIGRPLQVINELIAGKRAVTAETALGLAQAFETSVEVWLKLEAMHQASRLERDPAVALRAKVFSKGPISDLIRRGWITGSKDANELAEQVTSFYGLTSIDEEPSFRFAARKSASYETDSLPLIAWLCQAHHIAESMTPMGKFSNEAFATAIFRLKQAAAKVEGVAEVPGVLSDAGIRFLVLEHLPRTRVDGATFWLADDEPVIALSLRYERIDYFWHTLLHEAGHVEARDGLNNDNGRIDLDLPGTHTPVPVEKPASEIAADAFAASTLINQDALEAFISLNRPLFARRKILNFAHDLGVHPGILVGQLQYRGEILYSHSRDLLVGVRDLIVASAETDGWKKSKRSA